MKKFIFSILFILFSFAVYAQEGSGKKESFSDEFNREIQDIGKLKYEEYPMTLGINGGVYFPTSVSYGLADGAVGGSISLKYKFNFNKFFALSTDLWYSHVKGEEHDYFRYTTTSNMFDIKIMGIFQYETKKGESGFAPWIGTGPVISFAKSETVQHYTRQNVIFDYSGAYFGYVIALGARYNFKKAYVGANVDYTITAPGGVDLSGFRLNAEFGYRF